MLAFRVLVLVDANYANLSNSRPGDVSCTQFTFEDVMHATSYCRQHDFPRAPTRIGGRRLAQNTVGSHPVFSLAQTLLASPTGDQVDDSVLDTAVRRRELDLTAT